MNITSNLRILLRKVADLGCSTLDAKGKCIACEAAEFLRMPSLSDDLSTARSLPEETTTDGWKCITCGYENARGALRCQNPSCIVLAYSPEKAPEQLYRLRPLCICDNALTNQNPACPIHGSFENGKGDI